MLCFTAGYVYHAEQVCRFNAQHSIQTIYGYMHLLNTCEQTEFGGHICFIWKSFGYGNQSINKGIGYALEMEENMPTNYEAVLTKAVTEICLD